MLDQVDAKPTLFLNPGGDRRLSQGHPWAYANEIRMDAAAKALEPGTVVRLVRVDGKPFGIGTFNPHALIAFRLLDRDPATVVDRAFLADRLRHALALRDRLYPRPWYRLVHAEADGLAGLVVDRFDDVAVVQANTAGMDRLLASVIEALDDVIRPVAIVIRNDSRARALEGLQTGVTVAKGSVEAPVSVIEDDLSFFADVVAGQKTGWFFDQRRNRAFVAPLAAGGPVLDLFCHTGGFAVRAAACGASAVVGIDTSEPALDLARKAAAANGVETRCTFRRVEVFQALEGLVGEGARFRLVVADPPAFVKSRKEVAAGLRGYRKLARLAARVVEPGGFLFLASCSHNVELGAFTAECAAGLTKAGRTGRIVRAAGAGPDHPIHPHLPETAYLKTLVLQLD
ncbi:MAG: class I SAM-dependent rRNA methyltransferase [Rhodospirillales bacterium]|nr:MAG: class I SAM-dependent rRNA methyltransferase [Rhodospirillales bacterium]